MWERWPWNGVTGGKSCVFVCLLHIVFDIVGRKWNDDVILYLSIPFFILCSRLAHLFFRDKVKSPEMSVHVYTPKWHFLHLVLTVQRVEEKH